MLGASCIKGEVVMPREAGYSPAISPGSPAMGMKYIRRATCTSPLVHPCPTTTTKGEVHLASHMPQRLPWLTLSCFFFVWACQHHPNRFITVGCGGLGPGPVELRMMSSLGKVKLSVM